MNNDDALTAMEARKDAAYLERNQVVAALAKCFPSGVARTAIEGWSEDWHGCVYIDLPTGQASWHFHDSHAYLFEGLPAYEKPWDGHSTEEKYQRIAALQPQAVVPEGFALVPIRTTRAMEEVFKEEGWEWANLLAAAEAVTLEEYGAAGTAEPPPEAEQNPPISRGEG